MAWIYTLSHFTVPYIPKLTESPHPSQVRSCFLAAQTYCFQGIHRIRSSFSALASSLFRKHFIKIYNFITNGMDSDVTECDTVACSGVNRRTRMRQKAGCCSGAGGPLWALGNVHCRSIGSTAESPGWQGIGTVSDAALCLRKMCSTTCNET